MTGPDSVDDPEVASFRQRFKPREVRDATVIVVEEPLGDDGQALLQRGVQQLIRESGKRGFVCDVAALQAFFPGDGQNQLNLLARCTNALRGAGATFCYLNCDVYERMSATVWPNLLDKWFGGPRSGFGFHMHEAEAVDYVLQMSKRCPRCNDSAWTCDAHPGQPLGHDPTCTGPIKWCDCVRGKHHGRHGFGEVREKTETTLWELGKGDDLALVTRHTLVPGVKFELRVTVCGVLRYRAVYEDLAELAAVANQKREEFIERGWADRPSGVLERRCPR